MLSDLKICRSYEGVGVYWHLDVGVRVSNAVPSKVLESANLLFLYNKTLLEEKISQEVIGYWCYSHARFAFSNHNPQLGQLWLDRSREYGYLDHQGGFILSWLARLQGLYAKEQLLNYLRPLRNMLLNRDKPRLPKRSAYINMRKTSSIK